MVINHSFEEQLRKLISETQDELNEVDRRVKDLENQRSALAEELHSYEQSLRGYLKRIGQEEEGWQPPDWERLLVKCRTHKERLLKIAEHSRGELNFNPAVDIIYTGKYIKSKSRSNAYVQLYNNVADLVDKGELERVSPGKYKLTRHA